MTFRRASAALPTTVAILALASCLGRDAPVGPEGSGIPVSLAIQPHFSSLAADEALPTNRIRLTARLAGTNEIISTLVVDVNPAAEEWTLSLPLELPDGQPISVVVTIELINVTAGVESVQWSGVTQPLSVGEGEQGNVQAVEVYRGPPENLAVEGITITGGAGSLSEGDSTVFGAEVELSEGGVTPEIFWSSSDALVATVTGGRVRALRPGSTQIVATAGPAADTAVVQVQPKPSTLALEPSEAVLDALGEQIQLTAQVLDPRGDPVPGSTVVWEVAPAGVLEDLGGGSFRAAAPGQAVVTASAESQPSVRDSAVISVVQTIDQVVVSPANPTLTSLGQEVAFDAQVLDPGGSPVQGVSVTWASSTPSVASVEPSTGRARALANGTTVITADANGVTGSTLLTVEQAVATVDVTPAADTLRAVGETATFQAVALDAGGTQVDAVEIAWTSSDQDVATVTQDGVATAQGPGNAMIQAGAQGVTGSASLYVVTEADVAVRKSADRAEAFEGDTVTFTVEVESIGPTDAEGVRVLDPLPDGLTLISASATAGSYDPGSGAWEVGSLATGTGPETLTIKASVDAGSAGLTLVNVAQSAGLPAQTDVNEANDTDSAEVAVRFREADILVSKSVDATAAYEGDRVTFTVEVENLGPGDVVGLQVSDALPTGLSLVSATPSQGSYDSGSGTWSVGDLAASGGRQSLTLVAQVDSGTVDQTLTNVARSLGPGELTDPNPDNDEASASVTVGERQADVSVSKTASAAQVAEGGEVTFTVEVQNLGPMEATGVRIEDRLPSGLTFVSGSTSKGTFNPGNGLWSVGTLAAGDPPETLTLRATANVGTGGRTLVNRAYSRGLTRERDVNAANDTASASVTVQSVQADLAVTKVVDNATPLEGDTVGFTVQVQNQGPTDATNVVVQDPLPAGFSFVSAGPSQGAYDPASGQWNVGPIASGAGQLLFLTLSVNAGTGGQTLANVAWAAGLDQVDPDASNDTATVVVTPVSGAVTWQGTVSTDWQNGANWSTGTVPGLTEDVVVGTGAVNQPTLSVADTVASIVVQTGATLTLNATLTVTGDVSAGNTITGTGTVNMTGAGASVSGTVPNLTIRGSVTPSATLIVNGNLLVIGSGASFNPAAQSVSVLGSLSTQSSGLFAMSDPAGTVDVVGSATFQGLSQTTAFLTAGTLRIGGDFSQVNCCHTFVAGGTHTTVFNGSAAQTVSFATPSLSNSRFRNLEIDNSAGVSLASDIAISGNATVTTGTLTGSTFRTDIAGNLADAVGDRWNPDITRFTGNPTLPAAMTTNVHFAGSATLSNSFGITGDLTVTGSGAVLNLGAQQVTVTGNFVAEASALLEMDQAAAELDVQGNATFQGRSQTTPFLNAGTLRIGGNLTQINCCHTFVAGGTHTTVLNGTTLQTVSFSNPDLTQSRFRNLEIDNSAGVSLGSNIAISGNATVTNGTLTGADFRTDIAGNLVDASGGRWMPLNTRFTQNPSLPNLLDTNVEFTGSATLSNSFSITGNLTVTGSGAVLNLGTQIVTVTGNLVISSSGLLEMDQPAAELNVQGGALFQGLSRTTPFLNAGTLRVAGNLAQVNCCHTFVASGSHTTILNGSAQQLVSFSNATLTQSRFQNLEIDNAAGVNLSSNIAVSGNATVTNGTVTGAGIRAVLAGDLVDAQGDRWTPATTEFTGSPALPASMATNVEFTGSATLSNSFSLTGNLTVTGSSAVLNLGTQTVSVSGNLQVSSSGLLEMDQAAAELNVTGSATFQGLSRTTPFLTAGTLRVGGDFAQINCCHTFVASGTHTTVLNGSVQQGVNFSNSTLTQSRFRNLQIDNAAGVDLTSNIAISGTATVLNGTVTGVGQVTDIAGDLVDASGSRWTPTTTRFTGSPSLPSVLSTNVQFTGNATLSNSFSVVGNVSVTGSSAVLNLGTQTMSVSGDFGVSNGGLLEMDQDAAALNVTGNATFQGLSRTTPFLTAGTFTLSGDFTQLNCCHTFVAGGTHTTALNGSAAQTVTFQNAAATQSRFANLAVNNTSAGGTVFGSAVVVAGTLTADVSASIVPDAATPRTLLVTGEVNITGLRLDDIVVRLDGATLTAFNNVVFGTYNQTLTQLTVRHPGAALSFSFFGLTFNTTPSTGAYLEAVDTDGVSPFLVIDMVSTTPSSATSPLVVTSGGAVVNWPGG